VSRANWLRLAYLAALIAWIFVSTLGVTGSYRHAFGVALAMALAAWIGFDIRAATQTAPATSTKGEG
jgi:hypothetical protein